MANSAVVGALRVLLTADTAQFEKALAGATADTKKLATTLARDLEPTQRKVNQVVREFLGTRELGNAEAYARAVQQIGGANRLTAADQTKVNRAMQEALAQYKALGQQAPPHIKALADATKEASSNTASLLSQAKGLLGAFGIGVGVASVVAFGQHVFETADQIGDLALKMGVSAEAAQRFRWAARQSGADIEDVTRAVAHLNSSLGEGDKGTKKALADVGLEFEAIRAMRAEDAFRAVADAIGGITDPMRQAAAASALFGEKVGATLLPMIREQSLKAADAISVMANGEIAALKEAKQEWQNFWDEVVTISGKALAWFAVHRPANAAKLPEGVRRRSDPPSSTVSNLGGFAALVPPEVTAALAAAEEAARKAAAANAKELRDLAESWTSKAVEQQIRRTADAFEVFQKLGLTPTSAALKDIANDVDAWMVAGYKVPPMLERIWRENLHLVDSFKAMKAITVSGTGLPPGPSPNVTLGASPWLTPEQLQKGFGAYAGYIDFAARAAGKSTKEAKANLEDYSHVVTILTGNMQRFGSTGSAAWSRASSAISQGVQIVVGYTTAMKAAETQAQMTAIASSTAWAAATLGVSLLVEGFVSVYAQGQKFKADMKAATDALHAFGVEAGTVSDYLASHPLNPQSSRGGDHRAQEFLGVLQSEAAALQKITDTVDGLKGSLQAFGGVVPAALRPMLQQLLLSSNLTADLRAQLEALGGKPTWQHVQERAEALGISLERLGAGFNQARLADIALSYVRDLAEFEDFGVDMTGVLEGMADELSTLAQQALKTGAILPTTLKPYMEQLARMNLLLDENGDAIDLTSLAFKDIEDETLKAIQSILVEIRDLLAGLPSLANNAAQALQPFVGPSWSGDANMPRITSRGGAGGTVSLPGFAAGTHGAFMDFGPGTPVMLHGREAVVTAAESRQEIRIPVYLDGRQVALALAPRLPAAASYYVKEARR